MTCAVPLFVSLMWVSSVRQYSRSCQDLMAKLGFHVPRWRLRQPVRPGGFDHLCPGVLQNCGSRWMQPAHLAPAGPGSSPGTWNNLQSANRPRILRSEEHTSELQSRGHLVCRLLLEKKKKQTTNSQHAHYKYPI